MAKAKEELEQEILIKEEEKQKYLAERAPPLNTSGLNLQQLQVIQPLMSFNSSLIFIFSPSPGFLSSVELCNCVFKRNSDENKCSERHFICSLWVLCTYV